MIRTVKDLIVFLADFCPDTKVGYRFLEDDGEEGDAARIRVEYDSSVDTVIIKVEV